MALMTLDRHVVEINHTAEVITGYSVDEMRQIDPAVLALPEDRYLDRESVPGNNRGRAADHIRWRNATAAKTAEVLGAFELLVGATPTASRST